MTFYGVGTGRIILYAMLTVLGLALQVPPTWAATSTLAGCPVFPADNVWNTPIDQLPVDLNSSAYIASIGATKGVHPDFGSGTWDGGPIGIPYNAVPGSQPKVPITFDYDDESDPGPYPIPEDPQIEGGSESDGDRHVLVVVAYLSGKAVVGWASTVLPIYFIGGVQLLSLGLIGEYIGKIYLEVKKRPRFIIEEEV